MRIAIAMGFERVFMGSLRGLGGVPAPRVNRGAGHLSSPVAFRAPPASAAFYASSATVQAKECLSQFRNCDRNERRYLCPFVPGSFVFPQRGFGDAACREGSARPRFEQTVRSGCGKTFDAMDARSRSIHQSAGSSIQGKALD